jgi:phosphate transport system ATP-binding protein
MSDFVLSVRDLRLSFGGKIVLDQLSFDLPATGITCLLGPTDSGKTSLLRCLNRLVELRRDARLEGEIQLVDTDIRSMPISELRRRIGIVFPEPTLFPHLNLYDNLLSGFMLNRIALDKADKDRIVHETLEAMGLWESLEKHLAASPLDLDLCDRQLLCVARSLALKPDLLLLDEPTSTLNPHEARKFEINLALLGAKIPMLFSTYYPDAAARLSEHCIVLIDGKAVESGPTSRVFTVPESRETEAYLSGLRG